MSSNLTDMKDPETALKAVDSSQEGIVLDTHGTPITEKGFRETKRGLSPRHLQLITIAGGIGVGLFVGIAGTLSRAGPANLLLGYLFYSIIFVWPLSLAVGEMCAWLPIRGSIYELASRFVDPALGFAMGWSYFFAGVMITCTEFAAVAAIMGYWNVDVNAAVWVAMSIAVCYFLNMVAVRWYGETEFVLASTKVLLLIGLIIITFVTMVGGNPNHDVYGFRSWTDGNAMHSYYADGATGRFLGFLISIRYAIFTVGGPDFVALASGEIRKPRRTIPRVAKLILVRIVTFYCVGVLAVGIICNSRDPVLLTALEEGKVGAAASPWVIGLLSVGIKGFLPGFINFLILLSGLSCGNAYVYTSSRTLYSLAQDKHAPKFLLKCTKGGVPWVCVTIVTVLSFLTFLVSSNQAITVFYWFLDLSTVSLVLNFTAMYCIYVGWNRALSAQGIQRVGKNTVNGRVWFFFFRSKKPVFDSATDVLFPYVAPFAPYSAYVGLVLGTVMSLGIGFDIFSPWSTRGFVTSYFGVGWFLFMFAFWKIAKKTKFADPATVDIYAGGRKQAVDAECRVWEEEEENGQEAARIAQLNMFHRAWIAFWGS